VSDIPAQGRSQAPSSRRRGFNDEHCDYDWSASAAARHVYLVTRMMDDRS